MRDSNGNAVGYARKERLATEIAISDKLGSYGSAFRPTAPVLTSERRSALGSDCLPYGKTPSTPKMRCVAYLSPIATACL